MVYLYSKRTTIVKRYCQGLFCRYGYICVGAAAGYVIVTALAMEEREGVCRDFFFFVGGREGQ